MARKPKAPEQENASTMPDADIVSENQQPEQLEAPNIEAVTQPPEVDTEEVGNPTPEILEEAQTPEPISFEAFKAAQEAAAAEMPAPEEDTRQEWEKPLAEIEAEQQPKRKGRPPKAAEDKETSGQVGAVDKEGNLSLDKQKRQEKRRLLASSQTLNHPFEVQSSRGQKAVVLRSL